MSDNFEKELNKIKQNSSCTKAEKIKMLEDLKNYNKFEVFFELGVQYLQQDNHLQAICNFEKAIELKNEPNTKLLLAKSLKYIGKYRKSIHLFLELKKQKYELEELDREILIFLLEKKKYLFAKRYTDKNIKTSSKLIDYKNIMTDLSLELKNLKKYRQSLNVLFKLKKAGVDVNENLVIENLMDLKKFVILKKYTDKYLNKKYYNFYSGIFDKFDSYIFTKKQLLELEKICWDMMNDKSEVNKVYVEFVLFRVYLNKADFKYKDKFISFLKYKTDSDDITKRQYNYMLNKIEMISGQTQLCSLPINLSLCITSKCNAKCKFCGVCKEQWEISENQYEEILKFIPYLYSVSWYGGEVFLYKKFKELFDYAKKYDVQQEIVTNGTLLNEEWMDNIIASDTKLAISIRSVKKDKYEYLTEGASFDKLISNLTYIKKQLYKRHKKFKLAMYVLITKYNYMELEQLLDFAYEYRFDIVRLIQLDNTNKPISDENICDENSKYYKFLVEIFNLVVSKAQKYEIEIDSELPLNIRYNKYDAYSKIVLNKDLINNIKDKINCDVKITAAEQKILFDNVVYNKINTNLFCVCPWTSMVVLLNGNTMFNSLCSYLLTNINKSSLFEIWNSETVKQYRAKIIRSDYNDVCNLMCIQYNIHNVYVHN